MTFSMVGRLWGSLALVLTLLLASPPPARADCERTVGFAQDTMSNDWRIAQVREVEQTLAGHPGICFTYTDAKGRTAQQIMDIEDLTARGVDLLITSPRDVNAVAPAIARTYRKGIPVILLSRRMKGDDYTLFIGASNRTIARQAARRLNDRLGGRGGILVLQHIPTTTPAIERTEGFFDELKRFPDLRVVAMKRADSLRGKAIKAVDQALAEGLTFDAIYAQSDSMAAGARIALKRAGIDPGTIPIIGIDYISEARDAIRAGEQDASFLYPTFGREGALYALKILNGETVPREIIVESKMVTRDNVEQVKPIF